MEKQGIVKQGVTPPEDKCEKQASAKPLEDHVTKRLADAAEKAAAKPPRA